MVNNKHGKHGVGKPISRCWLLVFLAGVTLFFLSTSSLLAAEAKKEERDWAAVVRETRAREQTLAKIPGLTNVHVVPLPGYGVVAMYSAAGTLEEEYVAWERQTTYFAVMGDELLKTSYLTNRQYIVTAVDFSGNELIRVAQVEPWAKFIIGWKGGWPGSGPLPIPLPAGVVLPLTPIPNAQQASQEERNQLLAEAALFYRNGMTLDGKQGIGVEAWARGRRELKALADLVGRAYGCSVKAAHVPGLGVVFSYSDPGEGFGEVADRASILLELLSTVYGVGDNEYLAIYARVGADKAMLQIAPAAIVRKSRVGELTAEERQKVIVLWSE